MRYIIIDDCTTRCAVCDEHILPEATSKEEAIAALDRAWDHLTPHDQKLRDAFFLMYGPVDDGVPDYDNSDVIARYK